MDIRPVNARTDEPLGEVTITVECNECKRRAIVTINIAIVIDRTEFEWITAKPETSRPREGDFGFGSANPDIPDPDHGGPS